jgi:hypothetical protein
VTSLTQPHFIMLNFRLLLEVFRTPPNKMTALILQSIVAVFQR